MAIPFTLTCPRVQVVKNFLDDDEFTNFALGLPSKCCYAYTWVPTTFFHTFYLYTGTTVLLLVALACIEKILWLRLARGKIFSWKLPSFVSSFQFSSSSFILKKKKPVLFSFNRIFKSQRNLIKFPTDLINPHICIYCSKVWAFFFGTAILLWRQKYLKSFHSKYFALFNCPANSSFLGLYTFKQKWEDENEL